VVIGDTVAGVENIVIGRDRAIEILNMINPEDGEVLYGDRNGGIGYCPFWFTINHINYAATVRTANKDYIKLDKRVVCTNSSCAEDREFVHILILGFNWLKTKQIYLIKDLDKYLSHKTPGRGYLVFTKKHLDELLSSGEGNGGSGTVRIL